MLQAVKLNIKSLAVVLKLTLLTSGSISYRMKIMKKYYPFYIYHTKQQQTKSRQNLEHIKTQREQKSYENRIKSLYQKYSQKIKNQVQQKAKQVQQKERSQYQKQAQNLLHSGMGYLSLYYESLQNMIEGRRQVLHDQKFKFQDGQTVDEKRIRFEKYLSRLLGRKKQEIDRLQQQYEKKREAQKQRQNI